MNSFSRLVTALLLVSSLMAGSVASFAQTTDTAKAQKSDEATQSKTADKKDNSHTTPTTPTMPAGSGKPLSVNEDPAMIGKRNINKGVIAKMSGSTEKEVRLGRELAAEVDRQAKFVDDPVITEYVNRVGQNIVLHSDAKIPFTIKVIDSDEVNAFALPGFDEFLLGYKDRSAVLDAIHAQQVCPGGNGMFASTIVINGRVAGTWKRSIRKTAIEISTTPFAPLSKAERTAFAATAKSYATFMGLPAVFV